MQPANTDIQSIDTDEIAAIAPETVSEPIKPLFRSASITFVKEGKEVIAADGANLRIKAIGERG